jgi:hypothetical protein
MSFRAVGAAYTKSSEAVGGLFDFHDRAVHNALANNKLVKQFVQVERSDVEVNMMRDEFILKDMDMMSEGFEKAAPIKMKQGYIERADVKIPFGRLSKEPMLVDVKGIYIVCCAAAPSLRNLDGKSP